MIETVFKKPFAEQLEFFRSKVNIPTKRWDDLLREQHARGFMVAGAARDDILSDFRAAVDKTIAKGTTLKEFQDDFDNIVAKYGWSYKGSRNWRSELIYDTNIRTSHMAARYKQMTDPDVLAYRPFWEYLRTTSLHPREQHTPWVGLILPADDPWWRTHYPPNGWKCKCGVRARSERELKETGRTGPDEAPEIRIDPKTGAPEFIDRGWDYNVGRAAWGENQAKLAMESEGKWKDLLPWGPEKYGRPGKIPVDALRSEIGPRVQPGDTSALQAALRQSIGGDSVFFKDPIGDLVNVNQAITAHIAESASRWDGREMYFPLIPALIENPYEIWVNFAQNEISGRVAVRKRYIQAVQADKNRTLGLFAEIQDGFWVGGTFFRGGLTAAGNLRKGRLIYGRD